MYLQQFSTIENTFDYNSKCMKHMHKIVKEKLCKLRVGYKIYTDYR